MPRSEPATAGAAEACGIGVAQFLGHSCVGQSAVPQEPLGAAAQFAIDELAIADPRLGQSPHERSPRYAGQSRRLQRGKPASGQGAQQTLDPAAKADRRLEASNGGLKFTHRGGMKRGVRERRRQGKPSRGKAYRVSRRAISSGKVALAW